MTVSTQQVSPRFPGILKWTFLNFYETWNDFLLLQANWLTPFYFESAMCNICLYNYSWFITIWTVFLCILHDIILSVVSLRFYDLLFKAFVSFLVRWASHRLHRRFVLARHSPLIPRMLGSRCGRMICSRSVKNTNT